MDYDDHIQQLAETELNELRTQNIDHLYCGHCGGIDDVQSVNLIEAVRHLCVRCRTLILEWV